MDRTRQDQTKEIFNEALERAGREREEYLAGACSGDVALLERINSLLESAEKDDRFLAAAVVDHPFANEATLEEGPGSTIGPYELVELLGEGGFGSVFKATQSSPVQRTVALKVIKLGMDTRAVVARFEQERQALAIMDHPHVAKVFDAGATRSGRPYFAMEYVEGEPITVYCDRHALTIPQRLELFIQTCQAVQHAHTKGLIHRDLKPANVLVTTSDGKPFAKVIDFGVAKATRAPEDPAAAMTAVRQLIGTPQYMSPEQAAGQLDIDTRTDVYSLGVLLYELLTGCTPFDPAVLRSKGFDEMQRILREDDPPAPSTRVSLAASSSSSISLDSVAASRHVPPTRLRSLLEGELDWVVMRALEKDRARRYVSPGELASDLGRHLRGEAVEAAPPSRAYRLRKGFARHRVSVVAGAAVLLSLCAGLAAALWQASVAQEQRDVADALRIETELVAQFQADQLRAIDPAAMGADLRRDLLESVRTSLERSGLSPEEVASRESALIDALATANFTDVARGALDDTIFNRALATIDERFGDRPILRARLLTTLGETMRDLALIAPARDALREAARLREQELGPSHPQTLASLTSLARILWLSDMDQESIALCEEVVRQAQAALGPDSPVELDVRNLQGLIARSTGNIGEAERIFADVVGRRTRVLGPEHPDTLRSRANLSYVISSRGRREEAAAINADVLPRFARVLGPLHSETLKLRSNSAILLMQMEKGAEAEAAFRELLQLRSELRGERHPETLISMSLLGEALERREAFAEAEALYRRSLAGCHEVLGPGNGHTLEVTMNLGMLLSKTERPEEAEALLRRGVEGYLRTSGPTSLSAAISRNKLGEFLISRGKFREAEALYLNAERVIASAPKASPATRRVALNELVRLYERWHTAEPNAGHDIKGTDVRARMDGLGSTTEGNAVHRPTQK